ncbi:MAG: peptidylprolyl isomerase [Verrucomicrobiaceae bacterium]|nr:peptidylprolyl isomerase [Verrucomicrobiaceae bacterium]
MIKSCLLIVIAVIVAAVFVWKGLQTETQPAAASGEISKSARAELDLLKRQFQTTDDYQKRLAGQRLKEGDLTARITVAQAEQQELEARIPRITEAQARAWYDANKETLRIPPVFHAAHVFLTRHERTKPDRQAEIRAIHQQIVSDQIAFTTAAAKYSEDERTKKLQGDLGWFTRERMPADFIQAVETLKPGQISAPFLTGLGWHIVQLIEKRPSRHPTFEESKAEIHAMLDLKAREAALAQP